MFHNQLTFYEMVGESGIEPGEVGGGGGGGEGYY